MIREHRRRARACSLTRTVVCLMVLAATPAEADPFSWPQVAGLGTPITLRYSFSNLFDPLFHDLPESDMRAAAVQAFGLWAQYAPLNFIETTDSGPPPSDRDYFADDHPEIRIGAHDEAGPAVLAHAFFPVATDVSGLAGDIHFNSESILNWGIEDGFPVIDFVEVLAHEIGHALGLPHVVGVGAIMNPFHGFWYGRGGTPFLLAPDIAAIQAIYGAGAGSVDPVPEPSTVTLVCSGLIVTFIGPARRFRSRWRRSAPAVRLRVFARTVVTRPAVDVRQPAPPELTSTRHGARRLPYHRPTC